MDMALYNPRDRITQCCWAALILYLLVLHTTYSVDITCGFHALILLEKHYRLCTCNSRTLDKDKCAPGTAMIKSGSDRDHDWNHFLSLGSQNLTDNEISMIFVTCSNDISLSTTMTILLSNSKLAAQL